MSSDSTILIKAAEFAAWKHRKQTRKAEDRFPYIVHPTGVANILAKEGGVTDVTILAAALLHDTVEDTDTSPEEIKAHFGDKIASVVAELTDDKNLQKAERKKAQEEHAPHKSKEAKTVKLADKIYNCRDLLRLKPKDWTDARVDEYFAWSGRVIAGCADANDALAAAFKETASRQFRWENPGDYDTKAPLTPQSS